MRVGEGRAAERVEEGREEVDRLDVLVDDAAGGKERRIDDEERHVDQGLAQRTAVPDPTVFPELIAVISGDDEHGVIGETPGFQLRDEAGEQGVLIAHVRVIESAIILCFSRGVACRPSGPMRSTS